MCLWRFLSRLALTFALPFCIAACAGGSGSSGFDITEDASIARALDAQQCVEFESLVICPAATEPLAPTEPPLPAPTPSPAGGPTVTLTWDRGGTPDCSHGGPDALCDIGVLFSAAGLPADAEFRVAAREIDPSTQEPSRPWWIGRPAELLPTDSAQSEFAASVPAVTTSEATSRGVVVQFAVLAFLNRPVLVPDHTEHLVTTGANYAFVTRGVSLANGS